jgi:DNA repair ATPase RecN
MSYLTNQILRGAETIRRNSSKSNKNSDSAFNKNMTTLTDTPRTDAVQFQKKPISITIESEMLRALSRKLERELAAETANRKKCCRDGNQISDELFDAQQKLKKAEAEVERLNKQLNHIVENPHEYDVKSVFEPPFVEELQSEIKMLTKKLSITEDELADAREWLNERYKATSEADERAERAEAEVERLRSTLCRALEIADEFWDNQKQAVLVYHQELADELDQLKATLNPESK